eukprot:13582945-Alexandrium_andersonii.AAC.1
MSASLVGSEMCIRDSATFAARPISRATPAAWKAVSSSSSRAAPPTLVRTCLLYTSDAADDM